MSTQKKLAPYRGQPLSTSVLLSLLQEYERPYDKLGSLVKSGDLIQLRKGLYMTSTEIDEVTADPFLIANHLYGPSYVSLDSALSYWGLIPERVYQITSVCFKPSKSLNAAGRRYRFQHVPTDYYSLGIQTVARTPTQHVLIASPEKALCDKIVCTSGMLIRSAKQAHQLLFEDLRINENQLSELNPNTIKSWIPTAPKAKSLEYVIQIMNSIKQLNQYQREK